jgi:hypothetical protein
MITFYEFFTEALSLQQVRDKKMYAKTGAGYAFPEIMEVFGKKNRLIYDFELGNIDLAFKEEVNDVESSYNKIKDAIKDAGFEISMGDYIKGICSKKGDKNVYKIGRILASLEQPQISITDRSDNVKLVNEYDHRFKSDPIRHINDEPMLVVVSRHPYDIFGMSTGRSWTSCMDLKKEKEGSNTKYLPSEVALGTLVAYLIPKTEIKPNEKVALRKPYSRIALKPLRNDDNELAYGIGQIYGAKVTKFTKFMENWAVENFNKKVKTKKGFSLVQGVYNDPYEICDIEEAGNLTKSARIAKSKLERTKQEVMNLIDSKDRASVNIYYSVDVDETLKKVNMWGGVYWLIRNPEVKKDLNGKATMVIKQDQFDSKEALDIAKKYGFYCNGVLDNKYFKQVAINGPQGLLKIQFTADFQDSWEFEDIIRKFLMDAYPCLAK